MKNKLLLVSALLAMPAFGGTTAKEVIPAPAPAQPSLWNWFIGGSAGYLVDAEEAMYTGHVGVDTPWTVGGWNVALFAELASTEVENGYSIINPAFTSAVVMSPVDVETEVMPLTLNVKLERPLTGKLNGYVGAGLGVSFIDVTATSVVPAGNYSDDETVFTGQVFAGLVYNVSEAFEVFGGARWIFTDSADVRGREVDFDEDVFFEGGLRINF